MMTMDQLFNKLPRDLQWEVLSEFVGTHVVRNGKLMRKLVLKLNLAQQKYLVRDRPCYDWLYNRNNEEENNMIFSEWFYNSFNDDDHMRTFSKFAGSNQIMFCRDQNTDATIYMYRKPCQDEYFDDNWEAKFVKEDGTVLMPFKKNVYPSYPFTNKKMHIS